jgi:hypothetical protein
MSGFQSTITLGAVVIFGLITLFFNTALLENSTSELENKVVLTAFALADDLIEEMKSKSFDETTGQFPTSNPASLTPAGSLGPEAGEVYGSFNDIDDYNGFTKIVSAPHAEDYEVTCEVVYVQENYPDIQSSSQTFYKKATVWVSSPYMRNQIYLSFIFTLK